MVLLLDVQVFDSSVHSTGLNLTFFFVTDSPTINDTVAPPKKRKLPRESLSNDNSPPSTPTSTGAAKVSVQPNHDKVHDTNENDLTVDVIEQFLRTFFS